MVKEVEESIASGTARPLNIPSSLPNLPRSVVVSIDGKGCKKRRSITHKCSNHKDCPYSKHHHAQANITEQHCEGDLGVKMEC